MNVFFLVIFSRNKLQKVYTHLVDTQTISEKEYSTIQPRKI